MEVSLSKKMAEGHINHFSIARRSGHKAGVPEYSAKRRRKVILNKIEFMSCTPTKKKNKNSHVPELDK